MNGQSHSPMDTLLVCTLWRRDESLPLAVQPVAHFYTDRALWPPILNVIPYVSCMIWRLCVILWDQMLGSVVDGYVSCRVTYSPCPSEPLPPVCRTTLHLMHREIKFCSTSSVQKVPRLRHRSPELPSIYLSPDIMDRSCVSVAETGVRQRSFRMYVHSDVEYPRGVLRGIAHVSSEILTSL
jgi:hypothetical protein